jgi:modulator of FtsH protease HflK
MPWENRSGGRGPWGQGPSGPGRGGSQPPDLEEILRRGQDRLRQALPRGSLGSGGFLIIGALIVAVWALSGFYVVDTAEEGIVLRFGKYSETTAPGLHYHLPWPIESVETPNVSQRHVTTLGYSPENDRRTLGESLMLTGDENIIDVPFAVLWRIREAVPYLFNIEDPDITVKAVAESAMREVVGRSKMFDVLGQEFVAPVEGADPATPPVQAVGATREQIASDVQTLIQARLDAYGAGIEIQQVQFQNPQPPQQVIDAFRDVQSAQNERERARNEAEAYARKVVPEARGEAQRIIQEAEAYKQQAVAEAEGETQRFLSVYEQYRLAPEVTRERLFIETMERVLAPMNKIILDEKAGSGVVPYLPLPEIQGRRPAAPPANTGTATPQGGTP